MRMVLVSLIFFALYIGGVIALHRGLKPLSETVGLLRDLLPERTVSMCRRRCKFASLTFRLDDGSSALIRSSGKRVFYKEIIRESIADLGA